MSAKFIDAGPADNAEGREYTSCVSRHSPRAEVPNAAQNTREYQVAKLHQRSKDQMAAKDEHILELQSKNNALSEKVAALKLKTEASDQRYASSIEIPTDDVNFGPETLNSSPRSQNSEESRAT